MMDVNVRNSSYMYASPDNCDLHIENSASEGEGYCLIKTLSKEITGHEFFSNSEFQQSDETVQN